MYVLISKAKDPTPFEMEQALEAQKLVEAAYPEAEINHDEDVAWEEIRRKYGGWQQAMEAVVGVIGLLVVVQSAFEDKVNSGQLFGRSQSWGVRRGVCTLIECAFARGVDVLTVQDNALVSVVGVTKTGETWQGRYAAVETAR